MPFPGGTSYAWEAISELKANQAAAFDKFINVVWADLLVFCATTDGKVVSYPRSSLTGQDVRAIQYGLAAQFNKKLEQAGQNEITEISYMDRGFSRSQELVAKGAYITNVADLTCGISYYE